MWADIVSIISSLAIISGAVVAIYGINTWKREIRWRKMNDVAESAILLLYYFQREIASIRSPLSSSSEYADRKVEENETDKEKRAIDTWYVVIKRIDRSKDQIDRIRVIEDKCRIIFGKKQADYFNELYKIILNIQNSANSVCRHYWMRETDHMSEFELDEFFKEKRKLEEIIWGQPDDAFGMKINNIVTSAEEDFKPFIVTPEVKIKDLYCWCAAGFDKFLSLFERNR